MSETANNELLAEELDSLKAKAQLLGVKFHPSISAEKLAEKIKEHQVQAAAAAEAAANTAAGAGAESQAAALQSPAAAPALASSAQETEKQKIARIRANAEKLVRIRVQCMNPAKKEWPGEIFTVANRAVGTLKKFVPFNVEDGWHVPQMIYDVMKARECQIFVTTKTKNGVSVRKGKLIREFAIEVLDPLTKDELAELARRQAMEAGQTV